MKTVLGINLYSVPEVCKLLGDVKSPAVYRYIKLQRLRGQKIGGEWYISEDSLRDFLNGKK